MSTINTSSANESKVRSPESIILLAKGGFSQTRPDLEFSKAIDRLQLPNVEKYFISPIEFRFVNTSQLQQALSTPHSFGGIIFTSTRCVDAVDGALEVQGRFDLLEQWSKLKIFVVGEATKNHLFDKLQLSAVGHHTGNAAALAKYISECHSTEHIDRPLLYPCSNIRSDSVHNLLQATVDLKEIVCYETIPNPNIAQDVATFRNFINDTFGNRKVNLIVIFFSPSGVEYLLPHIQREYTRYEGDAKFIAFGKLTAAKLTELDVNVWFEASAPTPQALAMDISAHFKDIS